MNELQNKIKEHANFNLIPNQLQKYLPANTFALQLFKQKPDDRPGLKIFNGVLIQNKDTLTGCKMYLQSGKSSLIYTYKHDAPPMHKISSQQTDAVIKKIKYIKANKQGSQKQHFQCNIHLWDTTGQQSSDILNNILIKRVNGIILVFDRHSRTSFQRMKIIWSKIEEQRKKMYHVEILLIANIKEKISALSNNRQGEGFLGPSLRAGDGFSNRRKITSLMQEDYVRKQRNDIVLEDESLITSRLRRNSLAHRNTILDSPEAIQDFTSEIDSFQSSQQVEYHEISVQDHGAVRQVFQGLLGKVMKNIEQGKISLQEAIIKDTQGKIKLRKFDFKTYQYFEKRYNRCC